jgi:predicted dehydrogenase
MGYKSAGLLILLLSTFFSLYAQPEKVQRKPLRVGVVGLVHDHVHGILGRENKGDIEIVGIAEPNHDLAVQLSKQHGYDMKLVYPTMEEMIEKTKPDAVLAFNTIYDHLKVVEYCAPRGIHVMVEKPLAVNMEHAGKMIALAQKYKIFLLTNYETTWYGSNEMAYQLTINENKIGDIRKIVFHTGHSGPVGIGCSPQFLAWLTDPVLNGGGALTDFGCYGADLATWFMKGEEPISVTAVTQHIKPELYPRVEDEATIVLTYPKAQVIIEASWNWPYGRKDMELYGKTGYIFCKDATQMLFRANEKSAPENMTAPALPSNRNDPFVYFANVIRGDIKMSDNDLSSLHNNETVIKILDAAKLSANKGKTITWKELYH